MSRRESKSSPRKQAIQARRRRALELRRAGLTLQQIVDQHPDLGYKSRANLSQDLDRALRDFIEPATKDVLALELSRLDGILETAWVKARQGDLKAVDRVLRIMDRRAKYLGLDFADHNAEVAASAEQAGALGDIATAIREAYEVDRRQDGDDADDGEPSAAV